MKIRPNVPVARALSALILVGPLWLSGCGGESGSAADAENDPIVQEGVEVPADVPEGGPSESVAPPPVASAPAPTGAPPATSPPAPAVAPAPESEPTPAPVAEVEDPEPEAAPVSIPAGTRIPAVMEVGLSTRMNQAGDVFHARIVEEILAADGMVLVPEGSRLEGRIAESVASSDPNEQALLLLTFEAVVIGGERFPVQASVVEAEVETSSQASGTRSAATVATGAAAGAIVGQILGRDTRSTAAGAAVGAAAGVGVALTTRDGHAEIREGARIVIELGSPAVLVSGR